MPKALVCEDDQAIRLLIETVLRRDGFVVTTASDGIETSDALLLGSYDLIVLDLMMPRRSGVQVLAEIEASTPSVLPRIVVATAAVNVASKQLPAGLGAVLIKPFDLAEFAAAARRIGGIDGQH
jgi:DNA-binding response OmpR family regulator